ncbi:hypothetical protein ElP_25440 [Tautonia plasticadhaerens]|uniref:Toprim domain-containing protein n=1 Tax=Tautonia plasticadhaerens TaxID=2527974 RepID=A0A518H1E7_9BACT|nr:hypothetical protein ElP_25440 [Tautonia plasticadhaerens]
MGRGQRYSNGRRCPVCGGAVEDPPGRGVRCFGFVHHDGTTAFCTREEHAGGLDRIEQIEGFAHRLGDPCGCGVEHGPAGAAPMTPTPRPGTPRAARPKADRKGYAEADDAADALRVADGWGWVARWAYRDADGEEAMRIYRFEPADAADPDPGAKRPKSYRPFHRGADGRWYAGDPAGPLPLYRLPELADAAEVLVVEGEKAAEAARRLGLVACTSAHGAKSARKSDWAPLAGKLVTICPDNDSDGRAYASAVAGLLARLDPAPTVRLLALPDLTDRGDLVDWVAAGGTAERLRELVAAAPAMPATAAAPADSPDSPGPPAASLAVVWPTPDEEDAALEADLRGRGIPILAAQGDARGWKARSDCPCCQRLGTWVYDRRTARRTDTCDALASASWAQATRLYDAAASARDDEVDDVLDCVDFFARADADPDVFLVDRAVQAGGVTLLVAREKVGKSTLMAHLTPAWSPASPGWTSSTRRPARSSTWTMRIARRTSPGRCGGCWRPGASPPSRPGRCCTSSTRTSSARTAPRCGPAT